MEPQSQCPSPQGMFRITFLPSNRTITVDPRELPDGHEGLPGSILDIALQYGIDIDHACGGVCACSTCHVIIREGLESCSPATEEEEDQLDNAYGLTPQSRLACQCVPDGTRDLVIDLPTWNRNLAREGAPT
ncbi:MAG: 2Fe-2S iron-sulfur cluster binding domain-containing protein [Phycisphaerales bacterium]|nr:2Fe-2S iron-sulfur cluster binding domain-containing protein [Phycisphaerales bacterium]